MGRPLSELSPAYRRRLERAMAQGKTRQAARGHKAREHVERKAKELEKAKTLGALTTPQRQKIAKFAKQQAARMGTDPKETAAKMRSWAQRQGMDRMNALIQRQREYHRNRIQLSRSGSMSEDDLTDGLDFDDDGEDLDYRWLFYQ